MSEWKQKRFWREVSVTQSDLGYEVRLDGRAVKTPAKSPLVLPTRALADHIAAEWDAQVETVDPTTMPATRAANSALDKVTAQRAEVADMLADYGDSDLLCYRADAPRELADRQAAAWDPVLDWAAETLGARLQPRTGVMHAPQDPQALKTLSDHVHAMDVFRLAAFHDLVGISGSLILGFAAAQGWRDADTIWSLSRVDELWQEEQWGPDEEAQATADFKRAEFLNAKKFYDLA